jgi:hypothetical protein
MKREREGGKVRGGGPWKREGIEEGREGLRGRSS